MFATRRARGTAIGVVCVGVIAGYAVGDAHAAAEVHAKARRAEMLMRVFLPRTDPLDLLAGTSTAYRRVRQRGDGGVDVSVEVSAWWRTECVVAERTVTGRVDTVRVVEGRCT
jgi:hypothetical protein